MCVDITLAEGFINEKKKKEYFAWGHRKMFGKNSLKKKKVNKKGKYCHPSLWLYFSLTFYIYISTSMNPIRAFNSLRC